MALPKPNRNSLRVSDTALCRLAGLPKAGRPARAASRRSGRRRSGLPGAERHPLAGLWLGRASSRLAQVRPAPGNARRRRQVRLVGRFGGRRQHPRQGPGPLRHRAPGRSGPSQRPRREWGEQAPGGRADLLTATPCRRSSEFTVCPLTRAPAVVDGLTTRQQNRPQNGENVPGRFCAPSPHFGQATWVRERTGLRDVGGPVPRAR